MEHKIKALFEYQHFAPNSRLADMIAETERTFAQLSDDELLLVSAAGEAALRAQGCEGEKTDGQRDL